MLCAPRSRRVRTCERAGRSEARHRGCDRDRDRDGNGNGNRDRDSDGVVLARNGLERKGRHRRELVDPTSPATRRPVIPARPSVATRSALVLGKRRKKRARRRGERKETRGRDGTRERGEERDTLRGCTREQAGRTAARPESQHLPIYDATCSLLPRHLGGCSFGIKPRACCWDGPLPAGL